VGKMSSFIFPFSSRLITAGSVNCEYPWDVRTSMLLLLGLLNGCQVLLGVKKLFKNTAATPTTATVTAATQIPATGTAFTLPPTTGTQTPVTVIAAEPEDQPVPVSVTPIGKKRWTQKSACLVKEDESGPSQEQEEGETGPEIIT